MLLDIFSGPETAGATPAKVKDTTPLRESLPDIAEASASPAAAAVPESAAKSHQQPVKSEGSKDEGLKKAAAAEPRSTAPPPAPKDTVKDVPAASHPVSRV